MNKKRKHHLLLLSTLSLSGASLGALFWPQTQKTSSTPDRLLNEPQKPLFEPLQQQVVPDWNNPKNYGQTAKFNQSLNEFFSVTNDTNNNFQKQDKSVKWDQVILNNVVNNKYLEYVKLDFTTQSKIENAKTQYNGLTSEAKETSSNVASYSANNLNKNDAAANGSQGNQPDKYTSTNKLTVNAQSLEINPIYYPWNYPRQVLGTATSSTNGFTTDISFQRAANLPLNGEGFLFSGSIQVVDQNGNPSRINPGDVSIRVTNENVGNLPGKFEPTTLKNYQMTIAKKVTGKLQIRLNPASNHPDMVIETDITDQSPKHTSSSYFYNEATGFWDFTINGTNLTNDPSHYVIRFNGTPASTPTITSYSSTQVRLQVLNKIERPQPPADSDSTQPRPPLNLPTPQIFIKGLWQTVSPTGSNTIPFNQITIANLNSNLRADALNTNDSQDNPAGEAAFKFRSQVQNYVKEVNAAKQVVISQNQNWTMEIKNDVYDYARYKNKGSASANFKTENTVQAFFPKINPLFDFLTKRVTQLSAYDNEFYFGQQEMLKYSQLNDVNILFASEAQKAAWLTTFYTEVFQNVFKAQKNQTQPKYQIGPKNEVASELFIFEPVNWRVSVDIRKDAPYLTFYYTFFDGTEQKFTYPFRTKLFLNNLDKGPDDYNKWDLRIFEKPDPIDVSKSNIPELKYADIYYDLYNNLEGSQNLYNTIFQFKDKPVSDPKLKILETLFAKDAFQTNLGRANAVNIFDPRRMISFSTTNKEGKQYNSWSDLAKGTLKFNLDIGEDLKNFYLTDYRFLKPQYTYTFTGFNTQYDLYYNEKEITTGNQNNGQVQQIEVANVANKNVNTITPDWILNNLIVYDNQSANAPHRRRIAPNSTEGNNKILATNLLKEDFLQLVLKGQTSNIKISNHDTKFGTVEVEIKLANLGDTPSPKKAAELSSADKSKFKLLKEKASKTLKFKLHGFQQHYDLQYNFSQINQLDAKVLGFNENVQNISATITAANKKQENIKKLVSFDWYNATNQDPNFLNKLLKTRLTETEFFNLLEPSIVTDESKGNKGIDVFNGTYYGKLVFGADQTKQDNAIKYNSTIASPDQFAQLNTTIIPFSLTNLPASVDFYVNQQFFVKKDDTQQYSQYNVADLSSYTAPQLANPRFLLRVLNNLQLIDYNGNQPFQNATGFFNTNALSYEDLVQSLESQVLKFENITTFNEAGILQFDLIVDAKGGTLNTNANAGNGAPNPVPFAPNNSQATFKIQLINLKKTAADLDKQDYFSYTLNQVNQIANTQHQYLPQLRNSDVLDNLIVYTDTSLETIKKMEQILGSKELFEVPQTKADFLANLNTGIEDFVNGIQIQPVDERQLTAIVTIVLKQEINFNGQLTKTLRMQVENFVGKANLNWTIENNQSIKIADYNNARPVLFEEIDENFILQNMFRFADNRIARKYLLDNSYLSLAEFQKQQNVKINLLKDEQRQVVKVAILTTSNPNFTTFNSNKTSYNSLNFEISGFNEQVGNFNLFKHRIWGPVIWSSIALGGVGLIVLFGLLLRKIGK